MKHINARYVSMRRRICEAVGYAAYSRPARDNLDEKLQAYLPAKGFFIEAGAHDGYSDSNTYFLEKMRGWRGVLVEPIHGNYKSCIAQRSRSQVFNCALVENNVPGQTVEMTFGDRMSWVEGAYADEERKRRLKSVKRFLEPQTVQVPARTLTSVLEEAKVTKVDFLSLDVEGFEMHVLRGLDFSRFAPTFLLIECQTEQARDAVAELLHARYNLEAQLSSHDYLFIKH